MTSILWSGKVLVGDSRETAGSSLITDSCKKLYRLNGRIEYGGDPLLACGLAGASSHTDLVLAYMYSEDFPHSGFEHQAHGIIVGKRNVYMIEPDNGFFIRYSKKTVLAVGSGSPYVLSAHRLGLDPVACIKHAMKFDLCTGGKVKIIEV